MPKVQVVTEEHHRRPTSLDGHKTNLSNISYVSSMKHEAWHVLFGNMNAFQICTRLNHLKPVEFANFVVVCKFINGTPVIKRGKHSSHKKSKIRKAWRTLFGDSTFREVLSYINNVWLDPSYHLYLKKK